MHVVIYTRYWKIGGIERIILDLVKGLRPAGYRFSIITEDLPDPDRQFDPGPDTPIYFRELTPFSPENEDALRNLVLRLEPDVAMAMGSSRALYKLPRSLVDTDIPVILSEHNSPVHICEGLHGSADFHAAIRSYADLVHVLLEEYAQDAREPDRLRVIGNPVYRQSKKADVSNRPPGHPRGNVVLSTSRYDLHQKQQHILIEAFAELADRFPDWRLELYGDDWKDGKERLAALIDSHGLGTRVGLHGHSNSVADLMAEAQIFAFPSAFEGFPLSATEALSHGLPVIAFAECTGVNSLVHDEVNGLLATGAVKDVETFTTALERLMSDEDLRKRLSAAAPLSMERYSVEEFLQKWDGMLREAAALRGRNRLAKLSPMERDYLRLVGTGLLFDQLHGAQTKYQRLVQESKSLEKKSKKLAQKCRSLAQRPISNAPSAKWRIKGAIRKILPRRLWQVLHQGRKALTWQLRK